MENLLSRPLSVLGEIKDDRFSSLLARSSDLIVAGAVVGGVGLILLPLPAGVLSLLLLSNLALGLIIVLVSLSIATPLQLASYPTILLLTTVFRFCLSVAVTRSILSTGDAGGVITTLGQMTGGGNLIVGLVVFLIILVVQFIVVTKGAERVAEVAARFTLDAMPGKQMAIDADLRAGLMSQNEARRARATLQKESQLYGAMDGAMKFVKGDSIATVIITLVNIVAGFATGVFYQEMSLLEASQTFTILTIGDGLAAILPSVLIAVSAGLVVTRVCADEENPSANVSADVLAQIFAHAKPLAVTAALMFAFLFVPGMPPLPPLLLGTTLSVGAYLIHRRRRTTAAATLKAAQEAFAGQDANARDDQTQPTFAVPFAVAVSRNLNHLLDAESREGAQLRASLARLRAAIYYDTGVMLPQVYLSGDAPLQANGYFIAVKEVPVVHGAIIPAHVYVNDEAEHLKVFGLDGEDARNPADAAPGAWIPIAQRERAESAGLKVWEAQEFIMLHLSQILRRYAYEFIGIQETQALLDYAARGVPKLVEEVGKIIPVGQLTNILQRMVQEGISIRDLKSVLETLSEWGRIEKDPVMLTEYVRAAMKRTISFQHTAGAASLFVYLLDPEIEDIIRSAIRRTATGAFLSLDPATVHDIITALRREVAERPATAQKPVLVTEMELRRFIRKLIELEFPHLSVLSYQELAPELNIQPLARISLRSTPLSLS